MFILILRCHVNNWLLIRMYVAPTAAMNSSRLAWAVGTLHEGPSQCWLVSLHCLPKGHGGPAAAAVKASAVTPGGEKLDTRSCENFLTPPSQIDEGADSSHILLHPTDQTVLFRSPIVFYCYQQQSRTVSLASQKDAALCKRRTHYEQSGNITASGG